MNKPKTTVADTEWMLQEWNYAKNNELLLFPDKIGNGSNKTVWWICPKGHEYDMRVSQRARGQGCPYCSNTRVLAGYNDLATTNPEVLDQWDYQKNSLKPEEVMHGSHEAVWWKCKAGHSYQQPINKKISRKTGARCARGIWLSRELTILLQCIQNLRRNGIPKKTKIFFRHRFPRITEEKYGGCANMVTNGKLLHMIEQQAIRDAHFVAREGLLLSRNRQYTFMCGSCILMQ